MAILVKIKSIPKEWIHIVTNNTNNASVENYQYNYERLRDSQHISSIVYTKLVSNYNTVERHAQRWKKY